MIWICTDATINWNAVSAVGTSAAAFIALAVWTSGLYLNWRRRKSDARLLANLLQHDIGEIAVRFGLEPVDFWLADNSAAAYESYATDDARKGRFAELSMHPEELDLLIDHHLESIQLQRFDLPLEKIGIFDPATADSICEFLGCARKFVSFGKTLKSIESATMRYGVLAGPYYDAYCQTAEAAKIMFKALAKTAGYPAKSRQ